MDGDRLRDGLVLDYGASARLGEVEECGLLDYAPAAVGYVDGLDLPLTDPDFTDHIRALIATEHTPQRTRTRLQPRPKTTQSQITTARRHCTWTWG
ncbi:hypothetical protein [Streptomyces anulatus]|uniref:hypothetical protein n=1 Tax=Streptomyces anulatus TaxID=1892 RepID=UPI00386E7721|nr:hypothetical protein [Streptomyces sp. HB372]